MRDDLDESCEPKCVGRALHLFSILQVFLVVNLFRLYHKFIQALNANMVDLLAFFTFALCLVNKVLC